MNFAGIPGFGGFAGIPGFGGFGEPAAKVARTEGQGGWTCQMCGNHNFEGRVACNRRTCGAPDPNASPEATMAAQMKGLAPEGKEGGWDCQMCGNHNFEGRMVCNKRTCGAPKDSQGTGGQASLFGSPIAPGGQQAAGEGWVCDKCGNHNFEGRVYCNKRTCGNPGPWTCTGCANKNFAGRTVCNRKTCGQPIPPPPAGAGPLAGGGLMATGVGPQNQGPQAAAAAQAIAMLQAAGLTNIPGVSQGIQAMIQQSAMAGGMTHGPTGKQEVKEGSWMCADCGNVNFPTRDTCNSRSCGKPRAEVDGGPPPSGADNKSRIKPGSWVCSQCSNINWPDRDSCGMRRCGLPRAQVDAGPPAGTM